MQEKNIKGVNMSSQSKLNSSRIQAVLQLSQSQQKVQNTQKQKQKQIQKADIQYSILQQKKIMENIKTATELFNKKYFGNKNNPEGRQKKYLFTNPSLNLIKKNQFVKKVQSQCLLPQMKQIQMIFRTQNKQNQKKKFKKDKQKNIFLQNGHYSSFQLYQTKKKMLKQSIKLTELKIQKSILKQSQKIKIEKQNNQQNNQQIAKQLDNSNQLPKKTQNKILKPLEKQFILNKSIKSERQLLNIFQQNIIREKYQKPVFSLRQFLDQEKQKNPTESADNFQGDINQLTKVAKQMISQYKVKSKILSNISTEITPIQKVEIALKKINDKEGKNISWVIKECDRINKKRFSVRKTKSVSQIKKK